MNQALKTAVLEQLVSNGHLPVEQQLQFEQNQTLNLITILEQGLVDESVFASSVSAAFNIPLLNESALSNNCLDSYQQLSDFLVQHEVLPISKKEHGLEVAMVDPSNQFVIQALQAKLDCPIIVNISTRSAINTCLSQTQIKHDKAEPSNLNQQTESQAPIVRDINRLIQRAISCGASDIHFEPNADNGVTVRFRVSGMLETAHNFSAEQTAQVIARIKLIAKLDIAERRLAQNGRFNFAASGKNIDFRVSTLPLHNGESIVLRLLELSLGQAKLSDLGFRDSIANKLEIAAQQQQGLIVVTGPTGSGKSTTLYSLLNLLNKPEKKVISIEDPVELNVAGVNQIQVDDEHGISFAESLRSVLRQDPDVIMVGEIRDTETAQLAAQAALTGHLVLTTLHTSSAIGAITRLQNLGLPDYLINATLIGVVAQRLVRLNSELNTPETNNPNHRATQRTAIAEYLDINDQSLSFSELEENLAQCRIDGMSLRDDAYRLLAANLLSENEIVRVLGVGALKQ